MPAHDYAYNGSTIRLLFAEGDRVVMVARARKNPEAQPRTPPDGPVGQVVTVNHDDPDGVRFLIRFDEPVGEYEAADGMMRPVRSDWVPADRLALIQANVDWAATELRRLAAQPATQATVDMMRAVRGRYDQWTATPSSADVERLDAEAASLLADLPD